MVWLSKILGTTYNLDRLIIWNGGSSIEEWAAWRAAGYSIALHGLPSRCWCCVGMKVLHKQDKEEDETMLTGRTLFSHGDWWAIRHTKMLWLGANLFDTPLASNACTRCFCLLRYQLSLTAGYHTAWNWCSLFNPLPWSCTWFGI